MVVRAEPNVTPMIDVMLVLLIIFMVLGPTLVEGPAVPPAARYANRHPDEPGELTLGVDAQRRLYLNKAPVDSVTLRQRLESRFREHPEDRVIFLRADESLPFEVLQNMMALASGTGAQVVGLVSRAPVQSVSGKASQPHSQFVGPRLLSRD
jgi:biopolymer transport protein ExbD